MYKISRDFYESRNTHFELLVTLDDNVHWTARHTADNS